VRQVGYLQRLCRDARSTEHKIMQDTLSLQQIFKKGDKFRYILVLFHIKFYFCDWYNQPYDGFCLKPKPVVYY
jgi:hypothetical protein